MNEEIKITGFTPKKPWPGVPKRQLFDVLANEENTHQEIGFYRDGEEVGRFDFASESGAWEFSGDLALCLRAAVSGLARIEIEKLIVPGEES